MNLPYYLFLDDKITKLTSLIKSELFAIIIIRIITTRKSQRLGLETFLFLIYLTFCLKYNDIKRYEINFKLTHATEAEFCSRNTISTE